MVRPESLPKRREVPDKLEIYAISGLPEICAGAPLAELLCEAAASSDMKFEDGDVLVVAQKAVSKAEGRLVELRSVEPTPFACSLAQTLKKDPRHVEVILRERFDGRGIASCEGISPLEASLGGISLPPGAGPARSCDV